MNGDNFPLHFLDLFSSPVSEEKLANFINERTAFNWQDSASTSHFMLAAESVKVQIVSSRQNNS